MSADPNVWAKKTPLVKKDDKSPSNAGSTSQKPAGKATKTKTLSLPTISPIVIQDLYDLALAYKGTKKQRWVEGCTEKDYAKWKRIEAAWAIYEPAWEKYVQEMGK